MKFNNTEIKAGIAKALASGKETFLWDDKRPGFGIRVRNGRASWCVQYRVEKKQRRKDLGLVTKVDLEDAVIEAKQYFAPVARGVDPIAERAKAAFATSASRPFGDLAEDFIAYQEERVGKTYVAATATTLRTKLKAFHDLPLVDINRGMMGDALAEVAKVSGPSAADRSRAHVMKFFNWAIGRGKCENNPVDHTPKAEGEGNKGRHKKRKGRALPPAHLKQIWRACQEGEYGDIVKLLMLTGQRRNEIGALKLAEVDLDTAVIGLEDADRIKNERQHLIPLCDLSLAILKPYVKRARAEGRDRLFGNGATGFCNWSVEKTDLDKACGLSGWRHHDLRHTMKTWMQATGVPKDVRDAVQNHTAADMDALYGHYSFEKERRVVMDNYGKHINETVGPKPGLKLVA